MKRILLSLLFVVAMAFGHRASAQLATSYFMEGSYFRTELNPALVPTRGYIAMPAMSGVGLNLSNNFLSVDNLVYRKGSELVTALHGSVTADEFLGRLPDLPKLGVNANINLLGVGFYVRKTFWTFGFNTRVQTDMAISKDLFRAVKTLGNGTYNLGDTALSVNGFLEAYLGTSFRVAKIVNIGVRAKFLVGLLNAHTSVESIEANVLPETVNGKVRTMIYGNSMFVDPSRVQYGEEFSDDVLNFDPQYMLKHVKSYGGAIDVGAEVRLLNKRLRLSAAVTDLGFIRWSGATNIAMDASGEFHYNGFNLETGEADADGSFEMKMARPESDGYTTRLNCSINLGVEYGFLGNRIALGLLSRTQFCNTMKYTELTASVNFRPLSWLSASVSHTFLNQNKPGILGFALNIHPRAVNLFVGFDYMGFKWVRYQQAPIPHNMKSISLYCGLGFNFGRPDHLKN